MDHSSGGAGGHSAHHSSGTMLMASSSVTEAAAAADGGFCHGSGMIMYMDGACVRACVRASLLFFFMLACSEQGGSNE